MPDNPFYTFVDFVKCNNEVARLDASCHDIDARLEELNAQCVASQEQRDSAYEAMKQKQKEQHNQEAADADLAQQLRNKQKQLEETASAKSYMSLQQEITTLKHKKEEIENDIMRLWQDVEDATQQYQQAQKQYHDVCQQIKSQQEQLQQQKSEYEQRKQSLQLQERDLRDKVKPEWLEEFDRKRAVVPDPAVPVEHNVCSACFSSLPANELRKLEKHVLRTCPNCYRILYMV